jgi:heme/copper-type cytochrome/quinol oxidase subunit 2
VLIVRSVLASRRCPSRDRASALARGVELFWAFVPAVALAVLFFFTWRAIELRASLERHSSVSAMDVAR